MLALWWIGAPVEQYLGRTRFIGLYFVAGLAGSAGALVLTPLAVTVGASGAIFGILGALLIIEWQTTGRLAGNAMTWIVINLALSFVISNISIGGHVGGLIGGILATLAFASWGKGHAAYGKLGLAGIAGLVLVAAASVAIAYWKVRGLRLTAEVPARAEVVRPAHRHDAHAVRRVGRLDHPAVARVDRDVVGVARRAEEEQVAGTQRCSERRACRDGTAGRHRAESSCRARGRRPR